MRRTSIVENEEGCANAPEPVSSFTTTSSPARSVSSATALGESSGRLSQPVHLTNGNKHSPYSSSLYSSFLQQYSREQQNQEQYIPNQAFLPTHPSLRPALPGRTTRRKRRSTTSSTSFLASTGSYFATNNSKTNLWRRTWRSLRRMCRHLCTKFIRGIFRSLETSTILVALLLWYTLGIVSIGTSKYLLMKHEHLSGASPWQLIGQLPPLFLTFQQFFIGSTLLKIFMQLGLMSDYGLQPWPLMTISNRHQHNINGHHSTSKTLSRYSHFRFLLTNSNNAAMPWSNWNTFIQSILTDYLSRQLLFSAIFFSLGFLATNVGFGFTSASFVETIKAAEPITSASLAVMWGIEVLSSQERISLVVIVAGVFLSTIGNKGETAPTAESSLSISSRSTFLMSDSIYACLIVMTSNICFSCRGLCQKLFRSAHNGSFDSLDDVNLQYRMQQVGITMFFLPVLFWDAPGIFRHILHILTHYKIFVIHGLLWRYVLLAMINGCAFAGYNLASTFLLSRISVVHHAALNCIRRMFAIIITSILFRVPMTFMGVLGIITSFTGFLAFSHFKQQRQNQPKPISSLLPISAVKEENNN